MEYHGEFSRLRSRENAGGNPMNTPRHSKKNPHIGTTLDEFLEEEGFPHTSESLRDDSANKHDSSNNSYSNNSYSHDTH